MKKRSSLFLMALAISGVSMQANAYSVLSDTTTISPGIEGHVMEHTPNTNIDPTYTAPKTDAKAISATGKANENVKLYSNHAISLSNDTTKDIDVRIEVKLATHDGKTVVNDKTIRVHPNEIVRDTTTLSLTKLYPKPGYYSIYASTKLSKGVTSSANHANTVNIR